MTEKMWFSGGGQRVQQAVRSALEWCDLCVVVTDGSGVTAADVFWTELGAERSKVRQVLLSNSHLADGSLLARFDSPGQVRSLGVGTARGHFIWFERSGAVRFLLAPDKLCAGTLSDGGVWVHWEGSGEALPDGLGPFFTHCCAESRRLDLVREGSAESAQRAAISEAQVRNDAKIPPDPYSRPIPSVREVLGIRSIVDFAELAQDAQELALWSALIGEGAIDLEQAIRVCAERLRAQGFLEYQLLRQDGRIYALLEDRLLAARRSAALFDRPRNGFVRAVQPNLDELTAEQWRDCLLSSLPTGTRVDREQAVRVGFAYAQAVYGVDAQRLRGGGRADQALRSAINSAVRQGHLERDGAAYLIRVSESVAPTLRGVIPAEAEVSVAPSASEPTPQSVTPQTTSAGETGSDDAVPQSSASDSGALHTAKPADPVEPAQAGATQDSPSASPASHRPVSSRLTAGISSPPSPLDLNLLDLGLPTRTTNWAARQGIDTLRGLVAWDPEVFAKERNVGRRTVQETRELLEARLGCSWESARTALRHGAEPECRSAADDDEADAATEALTSSGASGWAELAQRLTPDERSMPLLEVELPARMRTFVIQEKLGTVGALFQIRYEDLRNRPNLGRKSLNDTVEAVRESLSSRVAPPQYTSFLQSWQAQLLGLETIPRMIVTRRAGMHGTREILEDLGAMLGVTRERVRQIEAQVLNRLRERPPWKKVVEQKLREVFGGARALPLDLIAQDPWWVGVTEQQLLLDYVVSRFFEDEFFLFEAPSGKRYLTQFPPSLFAEHVENAKARLAKLEYPVELSVVQQILRAEADKLDPVLFSEFENLTAEWVHLDSSRPDLALGYGQYRGSEVLAFLNAQAEPVPIAMLEEHCGRGALPAEVLYFKRGVVGLKRHFPDFEEWMKRLVPASLEVMQERPPGRQWLVPEIHDELRERDMIPEWLGHWHLASLLRLSGQVDYLGRLRVAMKDSGQEERLQYEHALLQQLQQAGGPLDFRELLSRARVHTDITEQSAALMCRAAPFVRLDDHRVGLVERDIPGGPAAVAAAMEAVVQRLSESQAGLTPYQATVLVQALSETHADWPPQLVLSLLRNDARVRIDRTKNIGLDEWDDLRCPARAEFIRLEVQKAGGSMQLPALYARMREVFGRAPDRGSLGVLANQVGLQILKDSILRPESIPPEASASRAGVRVAGIPAELRDMFEELVRQPLTEPLALRAEIQQHLDVMHREHAVNEFVDLEGAELLAQQCHELLERWPLLPLPERQVAHAAIRYFVSWQDVEHDLDIGGLDDDKQIMNAVLAHLGITEAPSAPLSLRGDALRNPQRPFSDPAQEKHGPGPS